MFVRSPVAILSLVWLAGCGTKPADSTSGSRPAAADWFTDITQTSGLDFTHFNGRFVANGGVATIEAQARAHDPLPLRMTPQLYRNLGNGRFEDVSSQAGAVFSLAQVGRGAAFGDIDNDGRTDVLVGNAAGKLQLLHNNVRNGNHWLGLRLVGARGRDMLGARVEVVRANALSLWRRARSGASYASANDPRVLVGLGASAEVPTVRVQWPSGRLEEFVHVAIDRYTTLSEGSSAPVGGVK
jgi:hypothetical protein